MNARISSLICGSAALVCVATWLLGQIMLRQPGAIMSAWLSATAFSVLFVLAIIMQLLLSSVAAGQPTIIPRLTIVLGPALLPLPLLVLAASASGLPDSKAIIALIMLIAVACVLTLITGAKHVRKDGDPNIDKSVFATMQLLAISLLIFFAPGIHQWLLA